MYRPVRMWRTDPGFRTKIPFRYHRGCITSFNSHSSHFSHLFQSTKMASASNVCPGCNVFFLELKKHVCREGLMARPCVGKRVALLDHTEEELATKRQKQGGNAACAAGVVKAEPDSDITPIEMEIILAAMRQQEQRMTEKFSRLAEQLGKALGPKKTGKDKASTSQVRQCTCLALLC